MSYDTRPLLTLQEKNQILQQAVEEDWVLFLEHDPHNEIISLKETEKGVRLNESHPFKTIF